MTRHLAISVALALSAAVALPAPADAEMRVRLKDGRVLTLPVGPDDVESVTFGPDGKADGAAEQPAERAARQIREDAERVRSAREAERRARDAAKAAEDAAKRAAEAANAARGQADAARAAREAAEKAARVAPESAPSSVAAPPKRASGEKHVPRTLSVGPGRTYAVPSEAAKAARDGDTVEIAAGTYTGDVALWRANGLTIRGVGGRAHMDAAGASYGGKAIWVIAGNDTVVENIEFSNCRVRDRNGAGIRLEGRNLTVRDSFFHDNQMGILTGHRADSEVTIEGSEFARNIVDYPRTKSLGHNIYIGRVKRFTLRNSYVHGAAWGHNVKSRARETRLLYNRIVDGRDGSSSYLVDIAEGGTAWLVGNVFEQGPASDNWAMISLSAERKGRADRFAIVNNTFVNARGNGVFVQSHSAGAAVLVNNILAGGGTPLKGPGSLRANLIARGISGNGAAAAATGALAGNFVADGPGFADVRAFDVRLTEGSPARDRGVDPGEIHGFAVRPDFEYSHPVRRTARPRDDSPDIGAYEFPGK